MTTEISILRLELIDNGSAKSFISDSGKIYGTGPGVNSALQEALATAQREGYTDIAVGDRCYDIATMLAD